MDQPWVFIVLFGLIFIVYAKIIPKTNVARGQANPTILEIEETMEHFTAELEEQNNALIQMLAETKRDYEVQTTRLSSRVEALEKQAVQTSQEMSKLGYVYEDFEKKAIYRTDLNPILDPKLPKAVIVKDTEEEDSELPIAMNLKTRYAELFSMYEQGKSTEYMAKKLNMNKGEINLIFQLAKQEEKLSAH